VNSFRMSVDGGIEGTYACVRIPNGAQSRSPWLKSIPLPIQIQSISDRRSCLIVSDKCSGRSTNDEGLEIADGL